MEQQDQTAEAMARLRAADPAVDAEPDLTTLRAAVQERWDQTPPDELARRRFGWPARLAAAAAAALVVGGGGGYLLGTDTAEPAAEVISLGGAGDGRVAPEAAGLGEADMIWPGWYGRTVFTASGLSDAGGSASAWGFDPTAAFNAEAIAAAAQALDVPGEPRLVDGMWVVGPNDGSAATVTLYPDGTTSLSYWDPTKDVWRCPVAPEPMDDGDTGGGVDPCTERDLGPAPVGEAAIAMLRDVLAALGMDPADFEFEASEEGDSGYGWASAYQVVAGQRSGVVWSASFTGAGIQGLYGSTAPLVALGDYQVVSPVRAVARLGDPRFGAAFGGVMPLLEGVAEADLGIDVPEGDVPVGTAGEAAARDAEAETSDVAEPPWSAEPPEAPAAGTRVNWPVTDVTIVEARLGLALHTQRDGSTLLVPTYELTGSEGGVWSVIAVVDEQLDFTALR